MAYVKLARVDEVAPGSMRKFKAGEKELLLVNVGGKFYTMGAKCTHMGGDLSAGTLEGSIVTCPKHGSQFDVTNGKNMRGPKVAFMRLKTADEPSYVVRVEGSDVLVDV